MQRPARIPVPFRDSDNSAPGAFTLVELMVVIAVIAILASLAIPALARAKARGYGIVSLSNTRQLTLAWLLYAGDHDDRLPYNLGGSASRTNFAPKTNINWVNNIMSWDTDPDNTNTLLITEASLGSYMLKNTRSYRCPSDRALSAEQQKAGWTERTRSYSMNAMLGHAGALIHYGVNVNNPGYRQFFTLTSIPNPEQIFGFIEEHLFSERPGRPAVGGSALIRPQWHHSILVCRWSR